MSDGKAARWEHFPHEADVGIRGIGATPAVAFEQAAVAMTAVMTDPALVAARNEIPIEGDAEDLDGLLFEWLNALVLEMSVRKMLFSRFEVAIEGLRFRARAWGEPVDPARHQPAAEVKAATYHALSVARRPDGSWSAECVLDV
jgi:tRNA nucleotidyltransferase (CCA-adding enzyme)